MSALDCGLDRRLIVLGNLEDTLRDDTRGG